MQLSHSDKKSQPTSLIELYNAMNYSGSHDCKLTNQSTCDICLCVDESRIPGIRHILVKSSPMFEAMLEGFYAEAKLTEVRLSDTTEFAATTVIHYLHGCGLNCEVINDLLSLKPSNQNLCCCLETISLAHKYMVPELVNFVQRLIANQMLEVPLGAESSCHVYQFAKVFDLPYLEEQSMKSMRRNIDGLKKFLSGPNIVQFMENFLSIFSK